MSTVDKVFAMDVESNLAIDTPSPLPSGLTGTPVSQPILASGGAGIYSFSNPVGVMPPGLTIGTDGVISGTPTAPGSYSFTVRVSD